MMLSGECSYTFGSVVKAVGRIRVWKSCGNWKSSVKSPKNGIDILGTGRSIADFVKVFHQRGVENLVVLDIL